MDLSGEGTQSNAGQGEQVVLVTPQMFLWHCKKGILESWEEQ